MRRSWMTPGAGKSQESFKNDPKFELGSIIRSFAKNSSILSRQQTFINEPGPGKSLTDIVNRLTNSVESRKSLTDKTRNLFCKQNLQFNNEGEMSTTETAINGNRISRYENDLRIRSMDQIESSRPLSSRINENYDVMSMRSSISRSRISSTVSINFDEELWPTTPRSLNTSSDISKIFSNSLNCQGLQQVAERLEDFIPTRDNDVQKIKQNYKNENIISADLDKINSPEIDEKIKDSLFNCERKKSRMKIKSRQLQSCSLDKEKKVCLISPKKNEVKLKQDDVINKNVEDVESKENTEKQEVNYAVQKNNVNDSSMNSVVNSITKQQKSEIFMKKNTKYDQIKSRYTCGISGGLRACAKQSKMMIPQSKRLRALFKPMAGIQEPTITFKKIKSKQEDKDKINAPIWRPGGSIKSQPTCSIDASNKLSILSQKKDNSLLRSKTFVDNIKTRSEPLKKIDEKLELTIDQDDCKDDFEKNKKRHKNSLNILKEIISYGENNEKLKKDTSESSSEESSINSKTLIEKLASLSDSSETSLTSDDDIEEEEKVTSLKSTVNNQSQTEEKHEQNQSLQTDITSTGIIDKKQTSTDESMHDQVTQTSMTSLKPSKENKDASIETIKLILKCQQINTDKKIMIDTANATVSLDNYSNCDTACQTEYYLRPIDIKTDKLIPLNLNSCDKFVSSFSNELKTSTKCIEDCCKKLSTNIAQQQNEIFKIPIDVIKAFELAAEKARNLHRAIEIYHNTISDETDGQKIDKLNSDNFIFKRNNDHWTFEESSDSFANNKIIKNNFYNILIQQDVQIIIHDILNQVDESINSTKNNNKIKKKFIIKYESDEFSLIRKIILPIIYGAICIFVFWSLQFSIICE
ncbi:uncharacterized protein LOC122860269 [Aphidius gifuensis]|uniref:uncharacterized protein LOC122860269 n=1 Tax=Aphidius gifuensis TaxID=684658 RepID=UPI001CDB72D9|nr:uncharacterized protein LOC122860269 [Aphidius gifuensis]